MILWGSIGLLMLASGLTWVLRKQLPQTPLRGWLLALFPASSFGLLFWQTIQLGEEPIIWSIPWITALELEFILYFDALSALFALLVTGIGTLIIVYAGYYFDKDAHAARFLAYLHLFMSMMLGLVIAGDVLTLFIFWEGTSVTSYLLVAYKYKYEDARRGAFKALFITGGGGIALLAGLLVLSFISGGGDFATILASGDVIRSSELYLVALGFVALGAFTKSAQTPFHIWLPDAMSAPTPASAFLHSATMVKAGIYLLARFNTALGQTEAWFWLLSIAGLLTMLTGAYLGTKQDDLKALLAYSTISQLGILVMLIGQDTEIAFKALVVGIVAHAFYKSALFMLAGIVDHETGTRLISRLGGLRKAMPVTFGLVVIVALSLAGLPPLFGFLAKETLLATAVHESLPLVVSWIFAGLVVVAAAFKLVQAGLVALETFTGSPKDTSVHAHEAPYGMLLAPAIPALFSLALGVLPEPAAIANFFGEAAAVVYGDKVKVSFALWTGLNPALWLSITAISMGVVMYWQKERWLPLQKSLPSFSFNQGFQALLNGIDKSAFIATRLQTGRLRFYLQIMIGALILLIFLLGQLPQPVFNLVENGFNDLRAEFDIIRLLALLTAVAAAIATVVIRRDFFAVLALGAAGLGVAVYMAVEPAPDVALVQIVVDILATVILALAIGRLPRNQRKSAQELNPGINWRSLPVAVGGGVLVTLLSFTALAARPRTSEVAPFFLDNAKILTGASDVVGAIIVDFRALDTVIEIAVFSLAGMGIYTLLQYAAKKHQDRGEAMSEEMVNPPLQLDSFGIGGAQTSVYVQAAANLMLPVALMIGFIHMLYGHDQPGDGFTAGVIIGLAVSLKYVVFGFMETRRRLWWLRPKFGIFGGIMLAILNGALAGVISGFFLGSVDYGVLLGIADFLPTGIKLSSGFVFEVAIALAVLGAVSMMLDTLGQPAVDVEKLQESAAAQEDEPAVVTQFVGD